jgi:hypothetical protein
LKSNNRKRTSYQRISERLFHEKRFWNTRNWQFCDSDFFKYQGRPVLYSDFVNTLNLSILWFWFFSNTQNRRFFNYQRTAPHWSFPSFFTYKHLHSQLKTMVTGYTWSPPIFFAHCTIFGFSIEDHGNWLYTVTSHLLSQR